MQGLSQIVGILLPEKVLCRRDQYHHDAYSQPSASINPAQKRKPRSKQQRARCRHTRRMELRQDPCTCSAVCVPSILDAGTRRATIRLRFALPTNVVDGSTQLKEEAFIVRIVVSFSCCSVVWLVLSGIVRPMQATHAAFVRWPPSSIVHHRRSLIILSSFLKFKKQ
jgi:hypothetical protein